MLQNAYFLAKIGADTAENEQHFAENLPKFGNYPTVPSIVAPTGGCSSSPGWLPLNPPRNAGALAGMLRNLQRHPAKLANFANFCNFLAGSFSAVSKRDFARKYAFDSIFQALQDLHTSAPLQSQHFRKNRSEKSVIFVKNAAKSLQMSQNLQKKLPNFKISAW